MLELKANGGPSRFLRVTAGKLVAMTKGVSWRTDGSMTTVTERRCPATVSDLSHERSYDSDSRRYHHQCLIIASLVSTSG